MDIPGIINLEKWNEKTLGAVRSVLSNMQLPCVGFCLLFMDYQGDHIDWKFKPYLAFDPHNPPPAEDRERLEKIFESWGALCQKIMDGGSQEGGTA